MDCLLDYSFKVIYLNTPKLKDNSVQVHIMFKAGGHEFLTRGSWVRTAWCLSVFSVLSSGSRYLVGIRSSIHTGTYWLCE